MKPALQVIPGGKLNPRDALRELYERYAPAVRSRCCYLLRNPAEAEDAMHEVFARALKHLESFRAEASPLTWLMQIATHHCLNAIRSRRAGWHAEAERLARLRPVGEDGVAPLEGRDLIRAVLTRFDLETQAAAVHYYVDEMTLDEVSKAIGRSVPTVRKRLADFAAAAQKHALALSGGDKPNAEGSHG
jgi:RNA polymerase sigma-70 factor, ECF subfamily